MWAWKEVHDRVFNQNLADPNGFFDEHHWDWENRKLKMNISPDNTPGRYAQVRINSIEVVFPKYIKR